jgi:3-hydroxyisobutyrate dehydrogenase-like beta-hydroxyacid dehydrogenase
MPDQPRLAVLGTGAMGAPIARNLVAAGFPVAVWNRSPERAAAIAGAQVAATPSAACAGADLVVSMLADDDAVEGVVFRTDGLMHGLRRGGCHVGMSTISVALSRRLAAAHEAAGQGYVAAPVFGRPDAAAARQLWIITGGPVADVERAAGVFAALGQGTFHLGEAAQASLAKLLGNFLIASTIEMLGEALTAVEKAGVPPARFLEVMTGTLFGAPVIRRYGQLIADTEFEPAAFRLELGLKDVDLALQAGEELRAPLPLGELLRERFVTALARGRGELDWSGIAGVIREAAGLPAQRVPGAPGASG